MDTDDKLRLDKWLWAARFFRTRALAKKAIEGGKVHYAGQRCKVSKQITIGDMLVIRQGDSEKEIEVIKLSAQRKGATDAQTLYQEKTASVEKREHQALAKKSAYSGHLTQAFKPNKKQRRDILKFKHKQTEDS